MMKSKSSDAYYWLPMYQKYIEAKKNWLPFCRQHVHKFISLHENDCIFIQILLNVIPKGLIKSM